MILLTHNQGPSSNPGIVSDGPYALFYDDADTCNDEGDHWVIINQSGSITSDDQFNLLIITP